MAELEQEVVEVVVEEEGAEAEEAVLGSGSVLEVGEPEVAEVEEEPRGRPAEMEEGRMVRRSRGSVVSVTSRDT